jgi:hypothetical protein
MVITRLPGTPVVVATLKADAMVITRLHVTPLVVAALTDSCAAQVGAVRVARPAVFGKGFPPLNPQGMRGVYTGLSNVVGLARAGGR